MKLRLKRIVIFDGQDFSVVCFQISLLFTLLLKGQGHRSPCWQVLGAGTDICHPVCCLPEIQFYLSIASCMPRSTGLLLLSSSLIKAPDSDSEAASSFDLMQLFLSYYSGPFLVYPMFLRSFAGRSSAVLICKWAVGFCNMVAWEQDVVRPASSLPTNGWGMTVVGFCLKCFWHILNKHHCFCYFFSCCRMKWLLPGQALGRPLHVMAAL